MIKHGWDLSDEQISNAYKSISVKRRYDLIEGHGLALFGIRIALAEHLLSIYDMDILDLGCGTGVLVEKICEMYPNWYVTGIDPAFQRDQSPRKIASNGIICNGSAYDIDADSSSKDLIIMVDVIEHLNRPDIALKKVFRALKPRGIILATMPNASAYPGWRVSEKLLPFKWAYCRLLPPEHPKRTWQPIDTLYNHNEIIDIFVRNNYIIFYKTSLQFLPPYLHSAPLVGRVYRKFNMDRFARKIFPKKWGYRFLVLAHKQVQLKVNK